MKKTFLFLLTLLLVATTVVSLGCADASQVNFKSDKVAIERSISTYAETVGESTLPDTSNFSYYHEHAYAPNTSVSNKVIRVRYADGRVIEDLENFLFELNNLSFSINCQSGFVYFINGENDHVESNIQFVLNTNTYIDLFIPANCSVNAGGVVWNAIQGFNYDAKVYELKEVRQTILNQNLEDRYFVFDLTNVKGGTTVHVLFDDTYAYNFVYDNASDVWKIERDLKKLSKTPEWSVFILSNKEFVVTCDASATITFLVPINGLTTYEVDGAHYFEAPIEEQEKQSTNSNLSLTSILLGVSIPLIVLVSILVYAKKKPVKRNIRKR